MTKKKDKFVAVVVNDDPTQLNILAGLLGKADIGARPFAGVEEALAAMDPADPPDLIVTDLYMPGIDGWRFCRLLRSPEYASFNEVPLLVVSATFAGDQPERIAADIGADAFLPSPVNGKEFVAQARALLAGKEARCLPRVLIVEDSRTLARLLKKTFSAHGYRADTALTTREAEATFAKMPYDAAVLDYRLPDGTGDTLIDSFRSQRPDCVCLMMTTDPTPELALSWMKRGAAAYLHKPFQPEFLIELCARARRERALLRAEDLLEARTRELRESELRLAESNQLLSGVLEHTHMMAVFLDTRFNFIWVNRAYADTCKHPPSFFPGRNHFDLYPHEENQAIFQRVVDSGEPFFFAAKPFEFPDQPGRGVTYWDWSLIPVQEDGLKVTGLVFTLAEVTERVRVEEALRTSEERLRLAHKATRDVVWDWDVRHDTQRWNEAGTVVFGWTEIVEGPVSAHWWVERVHPEDRQRVDEEFFSVVNNPEADYWRDEYRFLKADGNYAIVLDRGYVVRDAQGKAIRMIGAMLDITERKRAEEEREKLEAQLIQAQKMESIGTLAGGIAHDFNNILSPLMIHTEMALMDAPADSPVRDSLQQIYKAAERARDLVKQILTFARKSEEGRMQIKASLMIKEAFKFLRSSIPTTIDLQYDIRTEHDVVLADPTQFNQIVMNLCTNAVHAMGERGGVIKVILENEDLDPGTDEQMLDLEPGPYVKLTVKDTGHGIKPEIMDKIVDPYFTTKEVGKGTGLGLSQVHGIVLSHGGAITVHSEVGQGTAFHVYLPLVEGDSDALETPRDTEPLPRGTERILFVDDEQAAVDMMKFMLERLGYQVTGRTSSLEALEVFRHHPEAFDLVITDQTMPNMTGRELAGELMSIRPNIPVILCTGFSKYIDEHKAKAMGVKALVMKPLVMRQIAETIREALGAD